MNNEGVFVLNQRSRCIKHFLANTRSADGTAEQVRNISDSPPNALQQLVEFLSHFVSYKRLNAVHNFFIIKTQMSYKNLKIRP